MGAMDQIEPIEKASVDELRALQLERLRWSLRHAYEKVPHYRKSFDAAGVHPGDLKDLEDLAKFPFTAKADLRRPEIPGPLSDAARTAIEHDVEHHIKGYIGVSTMVRVVEPGVVPRSQGKAVRVIDKRPKT